VVRSCLGFLVSAQGGGAAEDGQMEGFWRGMEEDEDEMDQAALVWTRVNTQLACGCASDPLTPHRNIGPQFFV